MDSNRMVQVQRRNLGPWLALMTLSLAGCGDPPTTPAAGEASNRSPGTPTPAPGFPQPPLWSKQVLGALPGKTASRARDISDDGVVVGESMTGSSGTDALPFYWRQWHGIQPLPFTNGVTAGRALAISDDGRFVTGTMTRNGIVVPARWNLYLFGAGVGYLCGDRGGSGMGVNDRFEIVGACDGAATFWTASPPPPDEIPVVVLGTTMAQGLGLNNNGTIVGYGFQPRKGFYRSHTLGGTLLPLPADTWSEAHAVNNGELVVGKSWGSGAFTAVYWSYLGRPSVALGAMHPYGTVAISNKARVVWGTPSGGGTTRRGTTTHALALFPFGVNTCGDIVGMEGGLAVLYKKSTCD
jgi:hypothetical protein